MIIYIKNSKAFIDKILKKIKDFNIVVKSIAYINTKINIGSYCVIKYLQDLEQVISVLWLGNLPVLSIYLCKLRSFHSFSALILSSSNS